MVGQMASDASRPSCMVLLNPVSPAEEETTPSELVSGWEVTSIKVSCIGSCGVSNKINDTAWTVEEQYFNSTLSLADKGTVHKGLVQICGLEKLYRNVSPRLQHLLNEMGKTEMAVSASSATFQAELSASKGD
ncbi:hypothetical protein IHE44_0007097 [Lamprotornis superbus]|uniref:Uncharacterized protein n=1 Tax=Lamprotornis superbus TaxID=245042 RepID=A0A835NPW2_9PASS|nr:hypothetical protein IHE44_0007097 [Lamprotornis superbus]